MSDYHVPVMLEESLKGLNLSPGGTYVDATFGGGGHSRAILERIKDGRLIVFDQDEDAKKEADMIQERSFTFCQANFKYLKKYLKLNGVSKVNGILADLGISSHQIDSAERGFSTRFDGPLDMRMDKKNPLLASRVLNEYPEEKLHKIFGMYGEVKNARTLARAISQRRNAKKFGRIADLIDLLKPVAPRGKEYKYYAQVFQALRIEVNQEMEALESFLLQCGEVIEKGGRLVVMSYHSLEDRMVKNYMNTGKVFGEVEKDFFGNPIKPFQPINRKPVEASEEEVRVNNRARSARLRVAERTGEVTFDRE
ncbi:MAG TPA: 16S rRNA (cytosine(1402)-N(4))-methyltransferase RsmH [Cyclobacteriaceae bacterium]|nr:16S rRNA (cytosine(1402)-N(4))-methyltransferase RsmH [Cyclobacteriaceae bacterium]